MIPVRIAQLGIAIRNLGRTATTRLSDWVRRRERDSDGDRAIIADLAGPAEGLQGLDSLETEATRAELEALRSRLAIALLRLGRRPGPRRWGRRFDGQRRSISLRQRPWFLLIGPPGSGKTTALANAGLSFPLAADFGSPALSNLAGTRTCDWWFADDAVFIDTAGRYATQDSNALVDGAVWSGLLDLLKRHRPRQPINGVLVALSVPELAADPLPVRRALAEQINFRLRELDHRLGVRVPVTVLLTKIDRIAGFGDFFAALSTAERERPWGFALADTGGGPGAAVERGFEALVRRLESRLSASLEQITEPRLAGAMVAFPAQISALQSILSGFLDQVGRPAGGQPGPWLRGLYLTSAVREGVPFDLLAQPAPAMVPELATAPADTKELPTWRTSFLAGLMSDVLLADRGSDAGAIPDPASTYWRRTARTGLAAVTALMVLASVMSWLANRQLIADLNSAVSFATEQLAPLETPPRALARVEDADFAAILPILDSLRALPGGYTDRQTGNWWRLGYGFDLSERLGEPAVAAYRRALGSLLLPRLLVRLEQRLSRDHDRPGELYDDLKFYLMLGGQGPLDRFQVTRWQTLDWIVLLPGPDHALRRARLGDHLAALLEVRPTPLTLNPALIAASREALVRLPLAAQGYRQVRQDPAVLELPPWRLADQAGPGAAAVWVRRSGRNIAEGLPGLYTRDGQQRAVMPAIERVALELAREPWVLGMPRDEAAVAAQTDRLRLNLAALYRDDYRRRWQELLADLAIVPFRDLPHAVEVIGLLAGPLSPLRLLIEAAARETLVEAMISVVGTGDRTPAAPPATPAPPPGRANVAPVTVVAVTRGPIAPASTANAAAGNEAERAAAALPALLRQDGAGPSPLDRTITALDQLYRTLRPQSERLPGGVALIGDPVPAIAGGAGLGGEAGRRLQVIAAEVPAPLGRWAGGVAENLSRLGRGDFRRQLNAAWTATVLPLCRSVVAGRFPFDRASPREAAPDAFARLLGPGGAIDEFFNVQLKTFVDSRDRPWRWQGGSAAGFELPAETLARFEQAARIRASLFSPATIDATTNLPWVRLEATLVALDARVEQVVLEAGGNRLRFGHGVRRPGLLVWPTGDEPPRARLSFEPPQPGQTAEVAIDGPWALFRLFGRGRAELSDRPDRIRLTIGIGDRRAVFDLTAESAAGSDAINPFGTDLLDGFHCPDAL